jgi:hypothetical protein
LYLYNALNGKTLYKEDVSNAFASYKTENINVAPAKTEAPKTEIPTAEATKPVIVDTKVENTVAAKTEAATSLPTDNSNGTEAKAEIKATPANNIEEKTEQTGSLKDQFTNISVFKNNTDVQRSLTKVEETQTELK